MPRDEAHLLDILKAARLAIEFKGPAEKAEFRAAHPEVPWKLIAGTRDKLIHFYEGVDLDEVWKMVSSDLPQLIRWIEPLAPHTR